MKIEITGLNSGAYYLFKDKLSFNYDDVDLEQTEYNDMLFLIDHESALEITHTLLDSVGLLNKDTEKLLYEIEDKINGNN